MRAFVLSKIDRWVPPKLRQFLLLVIDATLIFGFVYLGSLIKQPAVSICLGHDQFSYCGAVGVFAVSVVALVGYIFGRLLIVGLVNRLKKVKNLAGGVEAKSLGHTDAVEVLGPCERHWGASVGDRLARLPEYWLSFLLAPILPGLPLILLILFPPVFVVFVAPIYGYLLVAGIPILLALLAGRLSHWHWFAVTGLLVGLLHMNDFADFSPPHYDLGKYLMFAWFGLIGGFVFWALGPKESVTASLRYRDIPAHFLLVTGVIAVLHLESIEKPDRIAGQMREADASFRSDSLREVPVALTTGRREKISLASDKLYRANCPVLIERWRDPWTGNRSYTFHEYTDIDYAGSRPLDGGDREEAVSRRCEVSAVE